MSGSASKVARFLESMRVAATTEFGHIRLRLDGLSFASQLIPPQVGNSLRASILRQIGFQIGLRTLVAGTPRITGGEKPYAHNLRIGSDCVIGLGCEFEIGTIITIGNHVKLDYEVMILTTTHELGPRDHRAGALVRNPVTIEDGAWIGFRSLVLPGVTIGTGAIVEPCSVVSKSVLPHARVAGNPARQLEILGS